MWRRGSWGDSRPLDVGLKVLVSWRESEGVKERPEKGAGC
jgi:hypothetical protein